MGNQSGAGQSIVIPLYFIFSPFYEGSVLPK
jgi:hypothetical protein